MRDGVIPPKFMRCTHDGPPRLGWGNMIQSKNYNTEICPQIVSSSAYSLQLLHSNTAQALTVCAAHAVTAGDVRVD